jgi:hypothetical protein
MTGGNINDLLADLTTAPDRELAADWRDYHHRHADMRIVAKAKHRTMSQANRPRLKNRQLVLSADNNTPD